MGPFLSKGIILISFFEKREVKGFFGLVSSTENIYFERWRIPVLIDERPLLPQQQHNQYDNQNINSNNGYRDRNGDIQHYQNPNGSFDRRGNSHAVEAAETERKHLVDFALQVVQKRLVTILEVHLLVSY